MYTFNDFDKILNQIEQSKTKLIYVAGASASGKSFFAEKLKKELENKGKKVFSVSSDMYYMNDSGTKYLLYGTYDHPKLIAYDQLAKDINEYFTKGKTKIPEYSFVEKRTVAWQDVEEKYDYFIVEGLYTISQLPEKHNPFKIFVYSDEEELIFRRLIRDQERTKEPLHTSIEVTSKVFPMRNIYGKKQKKQSDLIVYNDYDILSIKGKKKSFELSNLKKQDLGKLSKRFYITDFEYNDENNDNGTILISEVYKTKKGLLEYVIITKDKKNGDNSQIIEFKLFEPGILTGLHSLLQLAGLKVQKIQRRIVSKYEKNGKKIEIKEQKGKIYLKN